VLFVTLRGIDVKRNKNGYMLQVTCQPGPTLHLTSASLLDSNFSFLFLPQGKLNMNKYSKGARQRKLFSTFRAYCALVSKRSG